MRNLTVRRLLFLNFLQSCAENAAPIRLVDIDPERDGACPSGLDLQTGSNNIKVCARDLHPSSSVVYSVLSALNTAAHPKGLRVYSKVNASMVLYQRGSTDAFAAGVRDLASLESSNYVDGISMTVGPSGSRKHVFTFAMGLRHGPGNTNAIPTNPVPLGYCPCDATYTKTVWCSTRAGSQAPSFVFAGAGYICDSGNFDDPGSTWESHPVEATFTANLAVPTNENFEIRVMCEQVADNEDIGIGELKIDVWEDFDVVAPVVNVRGSALVRMDVETTFADPGANCTDEVDGEIDPVVVGVVDVWVVGSYTVQYQCTDVRGNKGVGARTVEVLDALPPELTLLHGVDVCLGQDLTYIDPGTRCVDNVDGAREITVTGNVNPNVEGKYVLTYSCSDNSTNVVQKTRTVTIFSTEPPGDVKMEFLELVTGTGWVSAGLGENIENVHPQTDFRLHWTEIIVTLDTVGCRYVSIFEQGLGRTKGQLVRQYQSTFVNAAEAVSDKIFILHQGSNATLSFGLKAHTAYILVVDEGFLFGRLTGRNVKQEFFFTTGDHTAPTLVDSYPKADTNAWPVSNDTIVLTFDKEIQAGTAGESQGIELRNLRTGESMGPVSCNTSDLYLKFYRNGNFLPIPKVDAKSHDLIISGISDFKGWKACMEYELIVNRGCVLDTTVNLNAAARLTFRFFTTCIVAFNPLQGARDVLIHSPITLEFTEAIQMGNGYISLTPLGEPTQSVSVQEFPAVYTIGKKLVLDLACQTKTCSLNVAGGSSTSSIDAATGLCNRASMQKCKGKPYHVEIEEGAVLFANSTWPVGTSLNGTSLLPAQLESSAYSFSIKADDITSPVFKRMDAVAISEESIRVTTRLDESSLVHCAALWGNAHKKCSGRYSLTLLEEISQDRCFNPNTSNVSRGDCIGCDSPSFDCFNQTAMWVDDGCSGYFRLRGEDVECHSTELPATWFDNTDNKTLDLGYRHGCAISKEDDRVSCWGDFSTLGVGWEVPGGSFSTLGVGYRHTCGILKTGELRCWGDPLHGATSPPAGLFLKVASGYAFSCAIERDQNDGGANSQVHCWGLNDEGQASPPANMTFLSISAGYYHVCGLRSDYQISCWGHHPNGETDAPTGVVYESWNTVKLQGYMAYTPGGFPLAGGTVAAGHDHTCAIRSNNGTVQCWGSNSDQQATPPGDRHFVQLAAGRAHTCGLIQSRTTQRLTSTTNSTAVCWGRNDYGQTNIPSGFQFSAIAAGYDFSCGITAKSSALVCWGKNDYGQSTPPAGRFGVQDHYTNTTCHLDTRPSSARVLGQRGLTDAGASGKAIFDPLSRGAETVIYLNGLLGSTVYHVYCFAEDDEMPTPNKVSEWQVAATKRIVTTLDRTPPVIDVLSVWTLKEDSVNVTLRLDEPGAAYCAARRDGEAIPSSEEVVAQGFNKTDGILANVPFVIEISGLTRDTEFDTYCTAHDNAGSHPHAQRINNWILPSQLLQTKRDIHTEYDATPPEIVKFDPAAGDTSVDCVPDGAALGCMLRISLRFNEDVVRGAGNVSILCHSNSPLCQDVFVPVEVQSFEGGTTFFENRHVIIDLTKPLADVTTYKVTVSEGAITDTKGNPFSLDINCEPWFDPRWQSMVRPCDPAYWFTTPS